MPGSGLVEPEEKNIVPEKYTDQDTESKGFYAVSYTHLGYELGRALAKVGINTPLHDREKSLMIAVFGFRFIEPRDTTVQPPMRHFHGLLGIGILCIARSTLCLLYTSGS